MKDYEDLEHAMKMLAEEIEGVKEYTMLAEKTDNPALKKMYMENAMGEKQHIKNIFSYVSQEVTKVVK